MQLKFINAVGVPYVPTSFLSDNQVMLLEEHNPLGSSESIDLYTYLTPTLKSATPTPNLQVFDPSKYQGNFPKFVEDVAAHHKQNISSFVKLGFNKDDSKIIDHLVLAGVKKPFILLEMQYADNKTMFEQIRYLSLKYRDGIDIVAGLFTSVGGCSQAIDNGASTIIVGGVKNITNIMLARQVILSKKRNVRLGAFVLNENVSDQVEVAAKCLAAGADFVTFDTGWNEQDESLRMKIYSTGARNLTELTNHAKFIEL